MMIEHSFHPGALAGPRALPHTAFSRRSEATLRAVSGLMARRWPLVVTAIYLDVALGILLGKWSPGPAQIVWHLLAIALTLCLAMMGGHVHGFARPETRPQPARARIEVVGEGAIVLPLLLVVAVASCVAEPVNPLPLHWPVRMLVCFSSLLLGVAALSRVTRLQASLDGDRGAALLAEE